MNPALTACSTSGSGEEVPTMVSIPTSGRDDEDVRTAASNELQLSFDTLMPLDGLDVTRFIAEAAFAINGKEADLARVQGVSHSTQSTWKKRGIIPAQHLRWFQESLVPAALAAPRHRSSVGWYNKGFQIALAIFDQTDFNPYNRTFASRAERIEACYEGLYGLVNIGAFVEGRYRYGARFAGCRPDIDGEVTRHTLELARLGTRLIELGASTPERDEYGNFLWPDGSTTGGTGFTLSAT